MNSIHLSKQAVDCIQKKLKGEAIGFENSGMSKREWNELMHSFGLKEKILDFIKNIQLKILPVITDRKNNFFMPYKFEKTLLLKALITK